jgi:DNA (cytosine-5)-methyltransferase 1
VCKRGALPELVQQTPKPVWLKIEPIKPKLISLFTGAGGLDLGLEAAGFETVVANELEPYACASLRANQALSSMPEDKFDSWFKLQLSQRCYGDVDEASKWALHQRVRRGIRGHRYLKVAKIIEGDIRNISSADFMTAANLGRGELDLVAGGPPCQPFSRAGKRETIECDTGRLFRDFVRTVDDLRPRWFLFENVKGLVITKTDILEIACDQCGNVALAPFSARISEVEGQVPCSKCCSFQTQQIWKSERGGTLRIILHEFESLGYKCYAQVLNAADYGAPQSRERLFIVGSRDHQSFEWPKPSFMRVRATTQDLHPELFSTESSDTPPWRTMFDALWKKGHSKYGQLDRDKAVLWVKNVVRPHDEPVTWKLNRPSPTIGAHQSAKLAIAPHGVPPEQLARQQWHVLGKRQGDLPPVHVEHTYLSDEELLALQTFPEYWYLFGTRMQRASQIGNAVPPVLAEVVGRQVIKAISKNISPPALESKRAKLSKAAHR